MKIRVLYTILLCSLIIVSCKSDVQTNVKQTPIPPLQNQLVNWSVMNDKGWNDMSFPIWFSKSLIDSLGISQIEMKHISFNFTDSLMSYTDTVPHTSFQFSFKKNGQIKKLVIAEMVDGIEIANYFFSYNKDLDSLGYSAPAISSNIKYRKKGVVALLSTFQELEQFQRKVFLEKDSSHISYIDKNSSDNIHHYYITDSDYWNVSFIDNTYAPEGKNVFYFGTPKKYTSAFTLENLVEKTTLEKRSYYSNDVLKKQIFYAGQFMTQRHFHYDTIGQCVSFYDSLKTNTNEFLHLEKGKISYHNNLPKYVAYYNEEDTLNTTPIKQIAFKYTYWSD
ncbi:hypothetical protein CW751_01535 [Brumimicrobium salinarum]|uniref:Uncharacterized protein n=1 Tax=Brumimicrobium salinarum TaxID=2058658 RepID=A0A2I0R640_9FLAO|nr:hypothetical protein [Brumimicrobium salinarum]PKR82046.1 hypothetical protein CW751_01535 [Brumimicrobium salinarum]